MSGEKKSLIFLENNEIVHSAYIVEELSIKANTISSNIAKEAFKNDTTQECILLDSKVNTIGESAFENCSELQFVEFSEKLKLLGSTIRDSENKELKIEKELELVPAKSLFIQYHSFKNCCNLHTIVLPKISKRNSLIIEKDAFLGCKELRTIVISGGYASIDEEAFRGCDTEKLVFIVFNPNNNCTVAKYAREHGFRCVIADSIK